MNNDFSVFNSCGKPREVLAEGGRVLPKHISWFVCAALLPVALLPVAASSPEDVRKLETLATVQARERADPWLAEERRLQIVLKEVKQRHVQLNRDQPFYSQAVVDETRDRMVRYIVQGVAPSEALVRAMQDFERDGLPALVLAE